MDWRQEAIEFGRTLGRETHAHELGVGIEFADGCDAFWILPGEVTSTVVVGRDGPTSLHEILDEYRAIDHLRERALHVLRHHLASRNIRVDRGRSGSWGLDMDGVTTSISVGARLTAVARDTRDVYAMIRAVLENSWIRDLPSREQIDQYLGKPLPPSDEPPASDRPTASLIPPTIVGVLTWMGLCKAIERPERLTSPDAIAAAVAPSGRIGQTLLRVSERLPGATASLDLLKSSTLSLEFDDGHATFDIDTRSRTLARRIAKAGPTVAGDELVDEFLTLNLARSRVFQAIVQAAADREWRQQAIGLPFFGVEDVIYLGQSKREVQFPPGEALTEMLRGLSPEDALRQLFADHREFRDACVAALQNPNPDAPTDLPEATLQPAELPEAPPLRDLDAALVEEMDRFAASAIASYWTDERTIWDYTNREMFDPATDDWATLADWVRIAEPLIDAEWPHPIAILVLLDAGDPRGDALARRYLQSANPHHEVSAAEVEIVWRYRHEFPDVARNWFQPAPFDDVPFASHRAALGDPVAIRATTVDGVGGDDPADSAAEVVAQLSDERKAAVHRELLTWARTDHHCSPPEVGKVRIALRMGWADVADALEANPYLLAGLLTHARRADAFDEPGLLLGKELLFVWSKLAPSPFLAQLVATAHTTDLLAVAERAARASAVGKPEVERNVPATLDIYRAWLAQLEPALAIAWRRCRRWLG